MKEILMGNEAIAWGLVNANVDVVSGYPGTPSSEILSSYQYIKKIHKLKAFAEWSVNEKVGFEVAYAAAVANKRACATMKQVGLNVASDSLMSAAYIGNKGGFVLVVADDPGFNSSQTEQDSRAFAKYARIPVLDPADPNEAYQFTKLAVELSEEFETPCMLRPVLRVCHSRQLVDLDPLDFKPNQASFKRDLPRWAALPRKTRLIQGHQQFERIDRIAETNWSRFIEPKVKQLKGGKYLILSSGTASNFALETLEELNLSIDLLKLDMPYPLPVAKLQALFQNYERVLVLEETMPVIEEQIKTDKVLGKTTGHVFQIDEITNAEVTKSLIAMGAYQGKNPYDAPAFAGELPNRSPMLCPGCPHRDVFFSLRKVFKRRAVYTSDIGCYTLGIHQGAIDTVLCMGGSIGMAGGFAAAGLDRTIVATIGDSTFLHGGIPPLVSAIYNKQKFVLVILDNSTTAMTGRQPTAEHHKEIDIKKVVEGLGIKVHEYQYVNDVNKTHAFLEEVQKASQNTEGPTVALVREFCVLDKPVMKEKPLPGQFAQVNLEACTGCNRCMTEFNCPPFYWNEDNKVEIDPNFCVGCGACLNVVCPTDAFVGVEA